jgi:hypothetical protein
VSPLTDDERRASPVRIALRIIFVVAALAVSAVVLVKVFDDLDAQAILDALTSLSDAEILSLGAMWILWLAAQGLQTAALVPELPVRRGVVAFLGPAAVASVVPGPSDLPVRYRMLTSWGRDSQEATLAVAAGGVFSIGIKLVLPVVAAIGLVLSDSPVEGPMVTVVAIALVIGLVAVAFVAVFSSEARTQRIGRLLDPVWRALLRRMRRPEREQLGARLVAARARAVHALRERWLIASWGTLLAAATRFALLLMALRFTGVPEDELSGAQVFVAYALVQGLTVVPITAGDAGVSEVALIGLLTAAAGRGLVNEITAAVIIFRLLTWLLIIPVGIGALGVWRRTSSRGTMDGA